MILVSVQPGQEVLTTITAELSRLGVRDGAIVSLVGAVRMCRVATMANDRSKDVMTEYAEPIELSGNGEVKDGTLRLHVVLGRRGGEAQAGRLDAAVVDHSSVHAYVLPLQD